ncbi:MAG: DNA polymerase III subunit alpha [Gammaproteobacteria bacterium]|nr:DNA polymerase III subunit alpha [Gammaproteobacteria bacterium]
MSFVHLQVHSEYSISDGLVRLPQLVSSVAEKHMEAIAITDDSNLYAAVKFYKAAVKAGIKPIIGVELTIENDEGDGAAGQLTLLCRNNKGYRFLCELLTRTYLERGTLHKIRIRRHHLADGAAGLIALSGGVEGEIGQLLLNGHDHRAAVCLEEYRELFSDDNFFLEISRVGRPEDERHLELTLSFAGTHSVPLVATNPVRFLGVNEFDAHEIRVCIHEGSRLDDARRSRRFGGEQWLRSTAEMERLFADVPDALENTVQIARRCNVVLDLQGTHMPAFKGVAGEDAGLRLTKDSRLGLTKRLQLEGAVGGVKRDEIPRIYLDRLNSEVETILSMGFADYFLVVAEFIQWAREQKIPVGPGRGSGAGSLVAWALGITEIDPLRYDLLFERFLNPERVSLPDFDIDFCMNGRDDVIEYVAKRYGRDRVAQIITFNTLAARAVVRDVGRVMGHSYGFCDAVAKMVPFEVGMTLDKALIQSAELARRCKDDPEVKQLIDNGKLLEGLARNPGKHAGGLVIAPQPLTAYTALYWERGMSQAVTQFDKDDLESLGLVKFDFLGLRTLTVIDWTVLTINSSDVGKGDGFDIEALALDDAPTFDLIRTGRATGLFQLESRGMQDLIRRLQPSSFEDLIALVALFRPGPLQSGMVDDFINRKQGREVVRYPHPGLEPILAATYGVILYQEQVMRIAQELAGYTLGAADLLRRAMGKKDAAEMDQQRSVFLEGAIERGVDTRVANHIFDLMEHFAGYGFNKSHSAAYALLAYRTAYLKAHYPAEFMAASLSADMDKTDKVQTLVIESVRSGLEVLPPDINASTFHFSVPGHKQLLYGLGAIKGVGEKAIEVVIEERATNGKYLDLYDFCKRVEGHKVNNRTCDALIGSGAFDALGEDRGALSEQLQEAQCAAEQAHDNSRSGQDDMFGLESPSGVKEGNRPITRWSNTKRLRREYECLGLYLTGHPVDEYQTDLAQLTEGEIASIVAHPERPISVAGLPIVTRSFTTRRGNQGAFVTLVDRTGQVDVVLEAELYMAHKNQLDASVLLLVEGVTATDDRTGDLQIKASSVAPMDKVREQRLTKLCLHISKGSDPQQFFPALQDLLARYRGGNTRVSIEYTNREGDSVALDLSESWGIRVSNDLLEALHTSISAHSINLIYGRRVLISAAGR